MISDEIGSFPAELFESFLRDRDSFAVNQAFAGLLTCAMNFASTDQLFV